MNHHHNQERMSVEDLHDIELQNITGGCEDCQIDGRIANATKRVEDAAGILEANGRPYPPGMGPNTVVEARQNGIAAIERIMQRHPNNPVLALLRAGIRLP